MKKILNHLTENWIRHGFETLVVTLGILGAFSLNNWNEERKEQVRAAEFIARLISDIQADTSAINSARSIRNSALVEIDSYFHFFDAGLSDLEGYVDSSNRVDPPLYRYFPVNFTYEEMKSSGNLNLLTPDQQQSLRNLASLQQTAQLIDDKLMEAYFEDANEERKFFPR